MGAALAKAAYAVADALSVRDHAPVRAYVFMALTAIDSDPAPSYFGGRGSLAASMAVPATESGFRSVERAVSTLSKRGLISIASKGAPGRHTRYRLLDGAGSALSPLAPRSVSGEWGTPHAERRVNNSEHPTLSDGTPHAERPEHPTLSVDLRKKEEKEEGTRAPSRTCQRHSSWEHGEPCRPCATDRRSSEAAAVTQRPSTMSERRTDCGRGRHRRLVDGTCMFCEHREFEKTA